MVQEPGIAGQSAPELYKFDWIGPDGQSINPVQLSDYLDTFIVLYCFQSWCPGCHKIGLPSLSKMSKALKEHDGVRFFAIQTVFEGKRQNTFDKLRETQLKYELEIPFGQDEGIEETQNISTIMHQYRTGGTPWFILIDQKRRVIFNDFHINTEQAIDYLKSQ